jgi:hypothetical protein
MAKGKCKPPWGDGSMVESLFGTSKVLGSTDE